MPSGAALHASGREAPARGAPPHRPAHACPRPLVVFLDEIDALRDEVLVSVLRQLRSGFRNKVSSEELMAFLHRVVNGGGSIEREYAIGRGRMDLCVRYGQDTLAIELKV